MFAVSVEHTFSAGHALRNYKGKCENVHGHNYRVRVRFEGANLNPTGMLVDFTDVKRVLRAATERLDHEFINDLPPFTEINPSAENMAKYFYEEMVKGMEGVANVPAMLKEVEVWETDIQSAVYKP
ncbi:MAG: 6-carboxytetrahydropterin synthase QueD [Bryobacteraceae bacterium]